MATLRNQQFTQANLSRQLLDATVQVVHVASHAQFLPGEADASYLQFWASRLTLDRFDEVPWNSGDVDLLVLNACQTSVGDANAENGFAGLALLQGDSRLGAGSLRIGSSSIPLSKGVASADAEHCPLRWGQARAGY